MTESGPGSLIAVVLFIVFIVVYAVSAVMVRLAERHYKDRDEVPIWVKYP